jgi:serine/threonine protein kinase
MWPFSARSAPAAPVPSAAASPAPPGAVPSAGTGSGPEPDRPARARWDFPEGAEIAPGRRALRSVGGGSRYEVFLAWDERLCALVVAKILRPDAVEDARARAELRREAELLSRLAHPRLVRGFGAVLDGPHPHLVLEHVEGPSLARLVRRHGALAPVQLFPLALELAGVLRYLEAEGVCHLDVKPGNVVMGVPARLIDLSIARPLAEAGALRAAIGTDGYMAPEQCAPREHPGRIGTATDVWALGATLFHAASGERPYPRAPDDPAARRDPRVRFPQLAAPVPALPPTVPAPFAALVRAMMDPDPAARLTPTQVIEALEPLVTGERTRPVLSRKGLPVA